eukprot:g5515.t1
MTLQQKVVTYYQMTHERLSKKGNEGWSLRILITVNLVIPRDKAFQLDLESSMSLVTFKFTIDINKIPSAIDDAHVQKNGCGMCTTSSCTILLL